MEREVDIAADIERREIDEGRGRDLNRKATTKQPSLACMTMCQ